MKFSVLMSIYKNESITNFKTAMDSILCQTLMPDEIVLVRDGAVPDDLQAVIDEYKTNPLIKYIPLEKNQGLGKSLAHGLKYAANDIVARMDTDDICEPNRFKIQITYLENHPEVDVLGGQIIEFIQDPNTPRGIRNVPLDDKDIKNYMKRRNPFNHMTVVFRKEKVLAAGSYQDMYLVEDYFLWCRMSLRGCVFANVPEVVVYARTGKDMFKRRGGYKYFKSWKAIEEFKLNNGMTSKWQYLKTVMMRFGVQVLMPSSIRGFVLENFSRKH